MSTDKNRGVFRRNLTFSEAAIALAAIAAVAALAWGGWLAAARIMRRRAIEAAWPKLLESAQTQRDKIAQAIEAYRQTFGAYPPDHVIQRQPILVDPVTNTLLYELIGTVFDTNRGFYLTPMTDPAKIDIIRQLYGLDDIRNRGGSPDKIHKFLKPDGFAVTEIHDDPDVGMLTFGENVAEIDMEIYWVFNFSPWRYVTTAATNNPGKFDLWMEMEADGRTETVGNWRSAR